MSVKRDKIIEYLNEYLDVSRFEDGCVNGLQIEGRDDVAGVVTGVSLSEKLIEKAIERKADILIVHHGLFKEAIPCPLRLSGLYKERIKRILLNDMNLAGYHLSLDAHPVIGNNISLCKLFRLKKCKEVNVGFVGELEKAMDFNEFVKVVDKKIVTNSYVLPFGKKKIKKVAIISGGSSPYYKKAYEAGADVLIAGDIREHIVREAEEIGINIINAGHYNTEKLGIQNLGELVKKKFGVKVEFVDVPNEI